MIHYLEREQIITAPLGRVWDFFADPRNLNDITPADMKFEIVAGGEGSMFPGQLIEYRIQFVRGMQSVWLTEIAHVREPEYFVDEQRIGPYRFWYHEHSFETVEAGVKVSDKVSYATPFGIIGELMHWLWIRRRLRGIFDFRRDKIASLFGEP
jgi:ligand-binding SRPBCC domain-containing protein